MLAALWNFVLVEPSPPRDGVVPPSYEGRVVAVGPDANDEIEVGDVVHAIAGRGHELEVDGMTLIAVEDSDIVAILV